jgi:DNA-binding transcriptional LysR family regulator
MSDDDWLLLKMLYVSQNLSHTAKELFLTQPAISKRLCRIEREFGITIAKRLRKGLIFTEDGLYLAEKADEILSNVNEVKNHFLSSKKNTLLIGTSNSFAKYTLLELLKRYNELHKDAMVFVTSAMSDRILDFVINKRVQVGFVRGEHKHNLEEAIFSMAQGYIVTKHPAGIGAISKLPMIRHSHDRYTMEFMNMWWKEHFVTPMTVGMEVNDADTTLAMVESGFGFGIFFEDYLDKIDHNLFCMPMFWADGKPMMRKTAMLYHKNSSKLSHVRTFIEYISNIALLGLFPKASTQDPS